MVDHRPSARADVAVHERSVALDAGEPPRVAQPVQPDRLAGSVRAHAGGRRRADAVGSGPPPLVSDDAAWILPRRGWPGRRPPSGPAVPGAASGRRGSQSERGRRSRTRTGRRTVGRCTRQQFLGEPDHHSGRTAGTAAAMPPGSRYAERNSRGKKAPMLSAPSTVAFPHQAPRGSTLASASSSSPAGRARIRPVNRGRSGREELGGDGVGGAPGDGGEGGERDQGGTVRGHGCAPLPGDGFRWTASSLALSNFSSSHFLASYFLAGDREGTDTPAHECTPSSARIPSTRSSSSGPGSGRTSTRSRWRSSAASPGSHAPWATCWRRRTPSTASHAGSSTSSRPYAAPASPTPSPRASSRPR
ncbi:hypothetical protein SHIRM173S_07837 [Streptomyces hirsutus]